MSGSEPGQISTLSCVTGLTSSGWVYHSINAPGNHDNRTQPFSSEAMAASSARCDPVFNYSMLFLSYRFSAITEESSWKSGVLLIFVCKHRSVQFFIWHGNLQTEVHWATVWAVSLEGQLCYRYASLSFLLSNRYYQLCVLSILSNFKKLFWYLDWKQFMTF